MRLRRTRCAWQTKPQDWPARDSAAVLWRVKAGKVALIEETKAQVAEAGVQVGNKSGAQRVAGCAGT